MLSGLFGTSESYVRGFLGFRALWFVLDEKYRNKPVNVLGSLTLIDLCTHRDVYETNKGSSDVDVDGRMTIFVNNII